MEKVVICNTVAFCFNMNAWSMKLNDFIQTCIIYLSSGVDLPNMLQKRESENQSWASDNSLKAAFKLHDFIQINRDLSNDLFNKSWSGL